MSNIQDIVELSIFHAIRKVCVAEGYLPDITLYSNTPSGYDAYQAAMSAIANGQKGFCVEVFNNSNPQYKGLKKGPRIVLVSNNILPGSTGMEVSEHYTEGTENFQGYLPPSMSYDFTLSIHLVAVTGMQIKTLHSLLSRAIPSRGYKSIYLTEYPAEGEQTFFIENLGFSDLFAAQDELLEKVYRYQIPDLMNDDFIIYTTTHAKLIQITLDSYHNTENLDHPLLVGQPNP